MASISSRPHWVNWWCPGDSSNKGIGNIGVLSEYSGLSARWVIDIFFNDVFKRSHVYLCLVAHLSCRIMTNTGLWCTEMTCSYIFMYFQIKIIRDIDLTLQSYTLGCRLFRTNTSISCVNINADCYWHYFIEQTSIETARYFLKMKPFFIQGDILLKLPILISPPPWSTLKWKCRHLGEIFVSASTGCCQFSSV